MEVKDIQHLYNRIGFGITPKQLHNIKDLSKRQILDTLFLASSKYTPLKIDTSFLRGITRDDVKSKSRRSELVKISRKKIREFNHAWLERLCYPNELLREKMTLFWANHFVCQDKNILFAEQYNNTLREHALGNFRTFVKAISKEPTMLKYLNNKQNRKKSPNENFARELMELFTLGQGNYSEKDIKESARAFTGYNHKFSGEFILRRRQHDYGEKTFFGKTGNFNGDDIIDIILDQKQCALFICKKIYKYFVNETINSKHVEEMANAFYPSYDIQELMRHVLNSDWFYHTVNIGIKIKSPIELLIGLHTTIPFVLEKQKQELLIQRLLGQLLLFPPNVAGWKTGKAWIDSNTIVTRLRLPSVLLNNAEISYSDKGHLKDDANNLAKRRLRRKAFIKTKTDWNTFNKNYPTNNKQELIHQLITSPINNGTLEFLERSKHVSKRDFCIQLLSLPEYQLC